MVTKRQRTWSRLGGPLAVVAAATLIPVGAAQGAPTTTTADEAYPPAITVAPAAPTLPRTGGSGAESIVAWGVVALAGGAFLVTAGARRRVSKVGQS